MLIIKLFILSIIKFIMSKIMLQQATVGYTKDKNYWGNVKNISIFSPGNALLFHVL